MLRRIWFFLSRKQRERKKWLNKWMLWYELHPEFNLESGCGTRGCKHYSKEGYHTCPWGALFVDISLKKFHNGGEIGKCYCIEWIKNV